ncbi:MAG: IS4 family transposase [Thermodesulfobacteriota bacterium]
MNTNTITTFRAEATDFTRTRKLPFWRVAVLILRGWKISIQNRINKFFDDLSLLENIPTASAFCQAREKIKPKFFKILNENVVRFFYDNYEKEGFVKRWKGHLIWAVDGSYINISDTAETREKYSIQVNQYNKEGVVQALASFLCDVLNEISINSSIDGMKSEKSFIFDEHIRHYRKDAIVIYDRLYADYSVAASHIKAGIDFVIRCPLSNTFKRVDKFIKSDLTDEIVSLKVTVKQKKFAREHGLPEEITVRLVKVKLENGEIEVLMTSLLDGKEYKVEDFKWLYNKRWGVETYLDRLKNQLEVERFSSEKLIGIEQDFYGLVFLSTFESVLSKEDEKEIMEESREKQLKYEYKINKSVSYSALVGHIVDLLLDLNKSPEEVVDDLSRLFRTGRTPVRPGRRFERKELTGSQRLRFHKYVKRIWA